MMTLCEGFWLERLVTTGSVVIATDTSCEAGDWLPLAVRVGNTVMRVSDGLFGMATEKPTVACVIKEMTVDQ